jgi:hypothetical protein
MIMNQMNTSQLQQQSPLKQQQQQQQVQMKNVIQVPLSTSSLPQLNLNPSHHHSQIQNGGILTVNSTMAPTNIQNQMISSNTNATNASALATMNVANSTTNSTTATNAASSNSGSVLINQINYLINLPLSKEEEEVLKDYDW